MALTYRNTDMTKWGLGVLRRLTSMEIDLNFWELYNRLQTLEQNPAEGIGISNITVLGSQLMIYMSDGSSYGPFALPIATFAPRGNYQAGASYKAMNLVTVPNMGLYLVLVDHTAGPTFNPDLTVGGDPAYLLVFGTDAFIYDIGFFFPGKPGQGIEADQPFAAHVFMRDVYIRSPIALGKAKLLVAPSAPLVFPLYKNNTQVGSIDFAAASLTGTFTFAANVQFAANDMLAARRPALIDTTARGLAVTLPGVRGTLT